MAPIVDLLRSGKDVRRFFAVYAQSAIGNGMGYVALVLVALQRFHSPWAVALVLVADLVPSMAVGPLLGGLADRLPRRACAVGSDLVRAGAFAGIALSGNLGVTVALAVLAGAGNAVFDAAVLVGLPSVAGQRHGAAATSLYGAVNTFGKTVGPVLAAALLVGGGVKVVLALDAASFLLSALVLSTVDLGRAPRQTAADVAQPPPERAAPGPLGLAPIILGSAGAFLFSGMANVAEPGFISHDLGAAGAGYSIMVSLFGVGVAVGSLVGSRGGMARQLWVRYLAGIAFNGAGYAAAALSPVFLIALPGFFLAGAGNGLLMVHERLLVQSLVPERAQGRAFGTIDMAASWAFAAALGFGALAAGAAGSRMALLVAGTGTLVVWAACALSGVQRSRPVAEHGL
jgi:predicted MFS family arabinose efflux permease